VAFTWKNSPTLGLLCIVSWGCCDSTLLCKTCLHAVYHQPTTERIKTIFFVLLGKWQQNGINKAGVYWMDCACLVYKICSYYNKAAYVRLLYDQMYNWTIFSRAATRPAWKCIHPKHEPATNAGYHGNLTKATSEPLERIKNSRKDRTAICSLEECRKGFINLCWRSQAIVEPKSAQQKIYFWRGTTYKRAYFYAFQTNGQIGNTYVGPQKLRWPRAPRFLNLSLSTTVPH